LVYKILDTKSIRDILLNMINKIKRFFGSLFKTKKVELPKVEPSNPMHTALMGLSEQIDRDMHNAPHHVTVENVLNEQKEFSKSIDPAAYNLKSSDSTQVPEWIAASPAFQASYGETKKKKLTKKQKADENTKDLLNTLNWIVPFGVNATQLQKASKIRRSVFLPLLKKLVKNGKIVRAGNGKRGSPYKYGLPGQRNPYECS
jgi:hypothetical protein